MSLVYRFLYYTHIVSYRKCVEEQQVFIIHAQLANRRTN